MDLRVQVHYGNTVSFEQAVLKITLPPDSIGGIPEIRISHRGRFCKYDRQKYRSSLGSASIIDRQQPLKGDKMDKIEKLLKELTEADGVPGYESEIRKGT